MRGTLYWSHLYILVRKGSPYTEHFRNLVSRIRDAGLPIYWEADVIRNYMSERLQLQIFTSRVLNKNTGPTKLNLNQLQGAFFLLVLGEAMAVIAFCAELAFGKKIGKVRETPAEGNTCGTSVRIGPASPFVNTFQKKHRAF